MTTTEAMDKVAKLMRLSKSSVPAEAALAMAKAQEIVDKFQLDISNIDFDAQDQQRDTETVKDFGYEDPFEDVKVHGSYPWMLRLTAIVSSANQCRCIHQRYDSLGDGKPRGAKVKIVGHPSDVAAARYIYGFLKAEVVRLCNDVCKGNSGTYKRQFCIGMVETIALKLKEQKKVTITTLQQEQSNNPMALVRLNNAIAKVEKRKLAVDTFINSTMKLRYSSGIRAADSQTAMTARQHGQIVGHQVRMGQAKGSLNSPFKQIN
jgi:hypothetical protein